MRDNQGGGDLVPAVDGRNILLFILCNYYKKPEFVCKIKTYPSTLKKSDECINEDEKLTQY